MDTKYNFKTVEQKWINRWEKLKTNEINVETAGQPFYNLMMFPYPSAEGLHVGNMFAFVGGDIQGRYHKMRGYDVFEPMGFDAFGIHSENYAVRTGAHPWHLIPQNIRRFEKQLKSIGNMFDWSHAINSADPSYYRWTQWIFVRLFKAGLAYRKRAEVNWCPACKTVLSDEQAGGGLCERCDSPVIQRYMLQWFLKITRYANKLLENLDRIDWSETTRNAQRQWIGRSEGAEIFFDVADSRRVLKVFTTRPDTLWGATFIAVSPGHPDIKKFTVPAKIAEMDEYVDAFTKQPRFPTDRSSAGNEKEKKSGLYSGFYAVHPALLPA